MTIINTYKYNIAVPYKRYYECILPFITHTMCPLYKGKAMADNDFFDFTSDNDDGSIKPTPKKGESVATLNGEQQVISDEAIRKFYQRINENASISMGQGSVNNYLQTALSRLDRFGTMMMPLNHELSGMTFITRPNLNLSSSNIRMDAVLSTLDTLVPRSIPFMMRALLDTTLSSTHVSNAPGIKADSRERSEFLTKVDQCPIFNPRSPFLTPLCNCLTDISGYSDLIVETETTAGGFYSEDMTYAKGSDLLNKSTELTLGFRDIQGGIVMALLYIWDLYIALQCKGEVMAYADDIYAQRLNYTVSIYRFTFDATREIITGWSKATGCYPKAVPIGARFNINQGEVYSSSAAKFTVPFVVNKIEYMNPEILKDFNTLVSRYWPGITKNVVTAANSVEDNMLGLPYVVTTERGLELKFYYDASDKQVQIDALSELASNIPGSNGSAGTYEFIKDWRIYDETANHNRTSEYSGR